MKAQTAAPGLTGALWEKFINSLCSQGAAGGLKPSQVLSTGGLTNADWEVMDITGLPSNSANSPKSGDMVVPALMQWANVMPQWAPNYIPSSLNFYDQYNAFLNAIALKGGNPALQQVADGYAQHVTDARAKLSADKLQMFKDWNTFNTAQAGIPLDAQTTYQQWYQDNYASTILADANALAAQITLYNQAIAAVGGPDYKTISTAQAKAALVSGNSLTYNSLAYPAYTVSSSLNAWYVSALQTLASGAPPAINFTITLDNENTSGLETSSFVSAGGSVSYNSFFWGGSASASYSQSQGAQSFDSLVQGITMQYQAQAAQMFSISPGPWFTSSIISDFYDQISPTSALANKPLFGNGGILNLRNVQLLVVFKPSVTLSGSNTAISSLKTRFDQQSSASINVGGFSWSASASASQGASKYSNDFSYSSDGTSVTMTDNTNAPKVLLVVPTKLGESSTSS